MPISWRDLHRQADQILDSYRSGGTSEERESILRAATSRHYYALFHRAAEWLEYYKDFNVEIDDGKSHQQLWRAFIGKGVGWIQNKGLSLHKRRCNADYHLSPAYTDAYSARFMEDCQQLHAAFDALPSDKLPSYVPK